MAIRLIAGRQQRRAVAATSHECNDLLHMFLEDFGVRSCSRTSSSPRTGAHSSCWGTSALDLASGNESYVSKQCHLRKMSCDPQELCQSSMLRKKSWAAPAADTSRNPRSPLVREFFSTPKDALQEVGIPRQGSRCCFTWATVNPRKLEHGFRRILARIPYTLP